MSRTTLSADSAERLVDDGGDRLVPQRASPLTGAFDHGVELLIGQCLEGAVDLFEARARAQGKILASGSDAGPSERGEHVRALDLS